MPTINGPIKKSPSVSMKKSWPKKLLLEKSSKKPSTVINQTHPTDKLVWELYYADCQLHCPIMSGKLIYDGTVIGDMNILQSLMSVAIPIVKSHGIEVRVVDPPYAMAQKECDKFKKKHQLRS